MTNYCVEVQVLHEGPIVSRADARCNGFTQYFTGRPCVHGHVDLRWTCSGRCKACQRKSTDEHFYKNREKYKSLSSEYNKKKWAENKDELSAKNKQWRERNKEYNKERMRRFRRENPEYMTEYNKEYRKRPVYKMVNHISNSMKRVLRGASDKYSNRKLGYTSGKLKEHLQSLFTDGMSWDNYGEWEIDHIIPMKWYFENGIDDPKIVNALSNLQPLWMSENRSKGGRYDPKE